MHKRYQTTGLALLFTLFLVACGGAASAPAAQPTLAPIIDEIAISADGRLLPLESIDLSFGISGRVIELLVAEGDVVASGDVIARLHDDSLQAAVAQAEAGLEAARANLALLPQQIIAAEADVKAAQAQLASAAAQRDSAAALIEAESALAQARFAQQQAQTGYDRLLELEILGSPEEQARLALQSAFSVTEAAQTRVNQLQRGSLSDRADSAQVAAASASLLAAQSQLEQLQAEASGEQHGTLHAAVQQAEATLLSAQVAWTNSELRAPLDGTIAQLNIKVGQSVASLTPVLVLADFSAWRIETEDLTEIDVPGVWVGQQVDIAFDALPELSLQGEVESIAALFQESVGDVVYPVMIKLLEDDSRLRWGMTTVVTFEK